MPAPHPLFKTTPSRPTPSSFDVMPPGTGAGARLSGTPAVSPWLHHPPVGGAGQAAPNPGAIQSLLTGRTMGGPAVVAPSPHGWRDPSLLRSAAAPPSHESLMAGSTLRAGATTTPHAHTPAPAHIITPGGFAYVLGEGRSLPMGMPTSGHTWVPDAASQEAIAYHDYLRAAGYEVDF